MVSMVAADEWQRRASERGRRALWLCARPGSSGRADVQRRSASAAAARRAGAQQQRGAARRSEAQRGAAAEVPTARGERGGPWRG
jgi:hypothetical protein